MPRAGADQPALGVGPQQAGEGAAQPVRVLLQAGDPAAHAPRAQGPNVDAEALRGPPPAPRPNNGGGRGRRAPRPQGPDGGGVQVYANRPSFPTPSFVWPDESRRVVKALIVGLRIRQASPGVVLRML